MTIEQANCPELKKLKAWLDENGIKYTCPDSVNEPYAIARVHFKYGRIKWSCIHGYGSYGGEGYTHKDAGLLELYAVEGNNEPIGYLTADEVIEIISTRR